MSNRQKSMSKRKYSEFSHALMRKASNPDQQRILEARTSALPLVDGLDLPLSIPNRFCPPKERWTSFLVFTTPKLFPCSGLLRRKTVSAPFELQNENGNFVPLDEDSFCQVFEDEALINSRNLRLRRTLSEVVRQCAAASPYVQVVAEIIEKPQDCSFGCAEPDDVVLQKLEKFAQPLKTSEEVHVYMQPQIVSTSSNSNSSSNSSSSSSSSSTSTNSSTGINFQHRVETGVCMRVSIMLNDSALCNHFASGFGTTLDAMIPSAHSATMARDLAPEDSYDDAAAIYEINDEENSLSVRESVPVPNLRQSNQICSALYDVLESLDILRTEFPLRCAATPVGVKKRIPRLLPQHGILLDLFDYQRRSVHWMMAVERRVTEKKSEVRVLSPDSVAYTTLPFTFTRKGQGGLLLSPRAINRTQALDVHGGVLAAKTGSGKTTTAIAFIYLQRVLEQAIERWPASVGDVANLPAHRKVPKWIPLNGGTTQRYYVNCTLVIAPRQVVQQWADEFKKTISANSNLRVHIIGTFNDLRKLSVEEVTRDIDVLIVNKQIFASLAYRDVGVDSDAPGLKSVSAIYASLCGKKKSSVSNAASMTASNSSASNLSASTSAAASSKSAASKAVEENAFGSWRISYLDSVERPLLEYVLYHNRAATASQPQKYPPGSFFKHLFLHSMHYRRIIIDEVHELDSSWSIVERAVASLSADTKWGLTATPGFDANHAFSFAHDKNAGEVIQTGYPALMSVTRGAASLSNLENMWPRYYFAALNAVTSTEVSSLPRIHLHRVPVLLTPVESAIYNSISAWQIKKRLMFCSHHVLDDQEWQSLLHRVNLNSNSAENSAQMFASVSKMDAAQVAQAMQKSRVAKMAKQLAEVLLQTQNYDAFYNEHVGALRAESALIDEICCLENNQNSRLMQLDAIIRLLEKKTVYQMQSASAGSGGDDDNDAKESFESEKAAIDALAPTEDAENNPIGDEMHRILGQRIENIQSADIGSIDYEQLRARQIALNERIKNGELDQCLQSMAARSVVASASQFRKNMHSKLTNVRQPLIVLERNLREAKRAYECTVREHAFFDAVLRRVTHPDEDVTCPICLDEGDAMRNCLVLASCGHELCRECACAHFKKSSNCPQCRAKLKLPDDLRLIDRRAIAPPPPPSVELKSAAKSLVSEKKQITDAYGSKLARLLALIDRLRMQPDGRKIIVQSQFEGLLRLTSAALDDFGIEHVYVGGSISQCQRAINCFKTVPEVTIMLLSSENTISGISLVEANHMIVLHPPLGNTPEESYATFWQAAGRMRRLTQTRECHMWSLVTQNTIEEELYNSLLTYSQRLLEHDSDISWSASADVLLDSNSGEVAPSSASSAHQKKSSSVLIKRRKTSTM